MKIAILPGSFKPPHLGHLQMIEQILLSKSPFDIIHIYISSKPRPLRSEFYTFSNLNTSNMYFLLKPFDSSLQDQLSKKEYIEKYKDLVESKKIYTIDAQQSLAIWKIYIDYLCKKYPKECERTKIDVTISMAPSPILSVYQKVNQLVKKGIPDKKIYLLKSKKNAANQRFSGLEKKYPNIHMKVVKTDVPHLHSKMLRRAILDRNEKEFREYLPKDLAKRDVKEIWNIVVKDIPKKEEYKK